MFHTEIQHAILKAGNGPGGQGQCRMIHNIIRKPVVIEFCSELKWVLGMMIWYKGDSAILPIIIL